MDPVPGTVGAVEGFHQTGLERFRCGSVTGGLYEAGSGTNGAIGSWDSWPAKIRRPEPAFCREIGSGLGRGGCGVIRFPSGGDWIRAGVPAWLHRLTVISVPDPSVTCRTCGGSETDHCFLDDPADLAACVLIGRLLHRKGCVQMFRNSDHVIR